MSNPESLDLTDTLAGTVDQITADSLIGRTITARITRITRMQGAPKKGDQPVNVYLDGEDLPWRPCLSMRRLLSALWTSDASKWIGQTVRLYRDDSVAFGGMNVGGVRVSHASIPRRMSLSLAATKGKKAVFTVEPLPKEEQPAAARQGQPARPTLAEVLTAAGLAMADLDRWAVSQSKPAASTLPPAKQQATADWLAADPSRIEALRTPQQPAAPAQQGLGGLAPAEPVDDPPELDELPEGHPDKL